MEARYDCFDPFYKSPFGPLTEQEACTVRISLSCESEVSSVLLCIRGADDAFSLTVPLERRNLEKVWGTTFSLYRCGLYFYDFSLRTDHGNLRLTRKGLHETAISDSMEVGESWHLSCCPADRRVPPDFRGAVMYQIFPDRFYRAGDCDLRDKLGPYSVHTDLDELPSTEPDKSGVWNTDFFGGNLRGIEEKLPYLASLGVSVLYLNPIFSARSNHRYDTSDYRRVDPMLGTNDDFASLCRTAHSLGMRILLDGVFSHTGSDSLYFDIEDRYGNGACHHSDSPFRKWYRFRSSPDDYDCWWGIKSLPCVDETEESFLDFLIRDEDSVIALWLGLGADGFRLDVADELPDAFLQILYRRVKALKPDALIIGEVWEDASDKISYGVRRRYFSACELDTVMNYPFRAAILDFCAGSLSATDFEDCVMNIAEHYPRSALESAMVPLSTHDTVRALTLLGDQRSENKAQRAHSVIAAEAYPAARDRLCAAAFLQFVLPGCPSIFYGDEVGIQGWEDPFCRKYFPWGRQDAEILAHYRALSSLKRAHVALRLGDLHILHHSNTCITVRRCAKEETLLCYLNCGSGLTLKANGVLLFSRRSHRNGDLLTLDDYGVAIIAESNGSESGNCADHKA